MADPTPTDPSARARETGINRARARREASYADGRMHVEGSIFEGYAACLQRHGRTIAQVREYGDAVAIAAADNAAIEATPPAQAPVDVEGVLAEVATERRRQVEKGWTPEHDDEHKGGEIATQAAFVLAGASDRAWVDPERHNRRERLVIAAALLVAEIERVDRAALRPASAPAATGEVEAVAIWSGEHRAYWRRGSDSSGCGYTRDVLEVGVWSRGEAERLTGGCGPEKLIALHGRADRALPAAAEQRGDQ